MIKIELSAADCQVQRRQVTNKTTGVQSEFLEQQGYLHTGAAYPVPFKFSIRNSSEAYPSGFYTIGPESFRIDRFGKLELDNFNFKLVPMDKNQLKAAS